MSTEFVTINTAWRIFLNDTWRQFYAWQPSSIPPECSLYDLWEILRYLETLPPPVLATCRCCRSVAFGFVDAKIITGYVEATRFPGSHGFRDAGAVAITICGECKGLELLNTDGEMVTGFELDDPW